MSMIMLAPGGWPFFRESSFEDLAQVIVTAESKQEERLFTSVAAATVLGHEEIMPPGATNVPEALRRVPGLNVRLTSRF